MKDTRLWSVILAGGEGERVKPLVQRWLGYHRPKQYCTFIGRRSMLQHTLDRADSLSLPNHKVTVIAKQHHQLANSYFQNKTSGVIIEQPANKNTAAGVFLPLSFVKACDPEALVVVYPSDHFVYPEGRFVEVVRNAVWAADQLADNLVLLAVPPDRPDAEFGWVEPADDVCCISDLRIRKIKGFREKPDVLQAQAMMESGALWSTMVFAGRIDTLWRLGRLYLPDIMILFDELVDSIGTTQEPAVLESIYQRLPSKNFSSDLLSRAIDNVTVMEMKDVAWSDWGKPDRIAKSILGMGKKPAFPPECMAAG